jgi:L-fuconolactonase
LRLDSFQYFTPDHPPEHLGPILARNRFDGSIAVCAADTLGSMAKHDFIKAALVRIDLEAPGLAPRLDECARFSKVRGVCWQPGDSIPESIEMLQQRSLTLDLQVNPAQLPLAIDIARRYPGLRIAILHLGSPQVDAAPSAGWANGMAVLARYSNVACKASDLIHLSTGPWNGADLRPYVQHVLTVFSPSRVMFGSGWPAGLPDHIWKETLAAFTQSIGAQSMEVREELLGGSAARFYDLKSGDEKQESGDRSQKSE